MHLGEVLINVEHYSTTRWISRPFITTGEPGAKLAHFLPYTLPVAGIAGGATYDAHILACAKQASAERLATFNRKHFQRLDLDGMELVVP